MRTICLFSVALLVPVALGFGQGVHIPKKSFKIRPIPIKAAKNRIFSMRSLPPIHTNTRFVPIPQPLPPPPTQHVTHIVQPPNPSISHNQHFISTPQHINIPQQPAQKPTKIHNNIWLSTKSDVSGSQRSSSTGSATGSNAVDIVQPAPNIKTISGIDGQFGGHSAGSGRGRGGGGGGGGVSGKFLNSLGRRGDLLGVGGSQFGRSLRLSGGGGIGGRFSGDFSRGGFGKSIGGGGLFPHGGGTQFGSSAGGFGKNIGVSDIFTVGGASNFGSSTGGFGQSIGGSGIFPLGQGTHFGSSTGGFGGGGIFPVGGGTGFGSSTGGFGNALLGSQGGSFSLGSSIHGSPSLLQSTGSGTFGSGSFINPTNIPGINAGLHSAAGVHGIGSGILNTQQNVGGAFAGSNGFGRDFVGSRLEGFGGNGIGLGNGGFQGLGGGAGFGSFGLGGGGSSNSLGFSSLNAGLGRFGNTGFGNQGLIGGLWGLGIGSNAGSTDGFGRSISALLAAGAVRNSGRESRNILNLLSHALGRTGGGGRGGGEREGEGGSRGGAFSGGFNNLGAALGIKGGLRRFLSGGGGGGSFDDDDDK